MGAHAADGRLADDEIAAFKQWLTDNKHVDLPAKDFLALTVTKILSDGTVADEERDELYAAIEAALPLDVREDVRGRRRALQDADRKQRRIEREAAHAARMRDTPLETWDFMVAATSSARTRSSPRSYAAPKATRKKSAPRARMRMAREPQAQT